LPGTPEWKLAVSADRQWSLSDDASAFVGGTVQVASDQPTLFNAAHRAALGAQPMLDGYATLDLRAGVNFGRYSLTTYVRNLTDSGGMVSAVAFPITYAAALGGADRPSFVATSIAPRTIGASLSASF
jgi:iron complex outermembrane receptor protein